MSELKPCQSCNDLLDALEGQKILSETWECGFMDESKAHNATRLKLDRMRRRCAELEKELKEARLK